MSGPEKQVADIERCLQTELERVCCVEKCLILQLTEDLEIVKGQKR